MLANKSQEHFQSFSICKICYLLLTKPQLLSITFFYFFFFWQKNFLLFSFFLPHFFSSFNPPFFFLYFFELIISFKFLFLYITEINSCKFLKNIHKSWVSLHNLHHHLRILLTHLPHHIELRIFKIFCNFRVFL